MKSTALPEDSCPEKFGCVWAEYLKHRPHRGLRKEHTRHGPARYLPGTSPKQIRVIETTTVQSASARHAIPPQKVEYVRPMDIVIGWDEGEDATISFVECSGGSVGGRSFHGRPMRAMNPRLEALK